MNANMNVTKNVVEDLLPVYLAGDASADTKQLVEEFLAADPAFAREVEQQKRGYSLAALRPLGEPPTNLEVRALEQTKAQLRKRTWLLAFAILFCAMPFSFIFDHGQFTWMMWRNVPSEAVAFLIAGLGFGAAWYRLGRKLSGAGL